MKASPEANECHRQFGTFLVIATSLVGNADVRVVPRPLSTAPVSQTPNDFWPPKGRVMLAGPVKARKWGGQTFRTRPEGTLRGQVSNLRWACLKQATTFSRPSGMKILSELPRSFREMDSPAKFLWAFTAIRWENVNDEHGLRPSHLNRRPRTPFFSSSSGGNPSCFLISATTCSSAISEPSATTSSSTIIAGARGRSSSMYSSVWYSARGFDVVSISIGYSAPSLDAISLKCLQGFPHGSFTKKRTFNMILSSMVLSILTNRGSMIV